MSRGGIGVRYAQKVTGNDWSRMGTRKTGDGRRCAGVSAVRRRTEEAPTAVGRSGLSAATRLPRCGVARPCACLVLLPQRLPAVLGYLMPADAADRSFETGQHAAAGRVVGSDSPDSFRSPNSADSRQFARRPNPGSNEQPRRLPPDIRQVGQLGWRVLCHLCRSFEWRTEERINFRVREVKLGTTTRTRRTRRAEGNGNEEFTAETQRAQRGELLDFRGRRGIIAWRHGGTCGGKASLRSGGSA